jgi:predicted transposase YdaD
MNPKLGMNRRYNIRGILQDPTLKRDMMVQLIRTIQAREGIHTSQEQAEAAYAASKLK